MTRDDAAERIAELGGRIAAFHYEIENRTMMAWGRAIKTHADAAFVDGVWGLRRRGDLVPLDAITAIREIPDDRGIADEAGFVSPAAAWETFTAVLLAAYADPKCEVALDSFRDDEARIRNAVGAEATLRFCLIESMDDEPWRATTSFEDDADAWVMLSGLPVADGVAEALYRHPSDSPSFNADQQMRPPPRREQGS